MVDAADLKSVDLNSRVGSSPTTPIGVTEGRGKREEGRGKREEGRGKREEGMVGWVSVW
jgi:hypothetical protein